MTTSPLPPLRSAIDDPRSARQSVRDPGDATTGDLFLGATWSPPRRHRPGRGRRPTLVAGRHEAPAPAWPRLLAVAVTVPLLGWAALALSIPDSPASRRPGVEALGPGLVGQLPPPQPHTSPDPHRSGTGRET